MRAVPPRSSQKRRARAVPHSGLALDEHQPPAAPLPYGVEGVAESLELTGPLEQLG